MSPPETATATAEPETATPPPPAPPVPATQAEAAPASDLPTRIVGIGASAGGLESLEQLFAELPPDTGMAFVVVQHLSPDFRSLMDELIARHSDMPVLLATDGVTVKANHVYLMPPGKEMIIREGRLQLTDKDPAHGLSLPIDQFLRSLALDQGAQAVAVILSGSGTDGSRGIVDVKRTGGMVLAESAGSARFDGMPLSALETGAVDQVRVPRDIARVLRGLPPLEAVEGPDLLSDDPATNEIFQLLRDQSGIDFSLYKTTTVGRRIQRRVSLLSIKSLEDYAEQLRNDADELNLLYQDLLIGVTQFFRDPEAFAVLEHDVIPQLLDQLPPGEEVRAWMAGCATGEEAYSIAMLLHEQMTARGRPVNLKILASDVHASSLEFASAGIYGEDQLANVSRERLERYFTRRPGGYQISPELRQLIIFARHNVTKDAPFTKMHFISCRNMLIYLQPAAQRTVLSLFHFGLAQNGVLFLGASESVGPLADEFVTIDEHWKIYRKRRDVHLLAQVRLPTARGVRRPPAAIELPRPTGADPVLLHTYDKLLDRFMPPSFLVDADLGLIDSFAGAEQLLKVRKRRPSSNLLDLVDPTLRTVIGGAVQRALKEQGPVAYSGVRVPDPEGERRCTLTAESFSHPRTGTRHVLVTFEGLTDAQPRAERAAVETLTSAHVDELSRDRMTNLETELAYTRETLQATIEELETSNEEMQATNEELVASNEELQSTNEELHSVNEELYTVNAEYQQKITELKELNTDMAHLLEGTDVGTVFLDERLHIRRFTARIASVFHILPHDLGRKITDFSHNIERPTLIEDIERVHRDGIVIEDEVRDTAGTPFFLRILPYRISQVRDADRGKPPAEPAPIHGVVLTLTDISALDKARARLAQLSAIVESCDDAIVGKALDGTITTWNSGAERLYGYTAEEACGKHARMLMMRGGEGEITRLLGRISHGDKVEHVQAMRVHKNGTPIDVSVTISPIYDRNHQVIGASSIARDITSLLSTQRELEERQARIELLLDSTAESIFGLDRAGRCTFVNPAFLRMLGVRSAEQLIGQPLHAIIHPPREDGTSHDEADCDIFRAAREGVATHSDGEQLWRPDGARLPIEFWSTPIRSGGMVVGAVVTCLDITERKQAEAELKTASRRREQFLAMLSHELRNPLAAVLNAIRVMQRGRFDSEAMVKGQQVVERQARHMARLLDDLLDVSRITRGKFELRKADGDLRPSIEAAIESTAPRLAERRITLDVSIPTTPFPVHGDPNRLQQVVVNLLSNAATYSPHGSKVSLRLERAGDTAVITVADEGMGIDPEMLGQIFELFVQADQRLDRSHGGLGVGLSLARTIVELHGGTIDAESGGPGRGSVFEVRLPLLRRELATCSAEPTAASRCKIVLVEDLADSREMLRLLLESNGHVVVDVDDGRAAVDAIDREHPQVALVDIGLPGMNGYEVAQEIRRRPHLSDVLLVALTGYGAPSDLAAAKEAGFDEHVIKPPDIERIEEILARRTKC
jgi:two-component system CheB/CheR fusion protein